MRTKTKKRRYTEAERREFQQQALSRAVGNVSFTNYPIIIESFVARGIPADDIRPRENVFSFNAWKALGRVVRKGEKGVKVISYAEFSKTERDAQTGKETKIAGRRPVSAYVFHVTQTEPINKPAEQPAPEGWDSVETSTEETSLATLSRLAFGRITY